MTLIADDSAVLAKTRELCAVIAGDPVFMSLQASVERFLSNDEARLQYQSVHERGEELHHKQHAGIQLGSQEIREFEAAREALFENPLARDFFSAREQLETLQKEISRHVNLTLELGRVPSEEDLSEASGGCCSGGGCGCSH
ncbi:MAG: YlbF family regulator [Luteolibacter sp.]